MIYPGNYRLSRDVRNPTPDRRKKDDWTAWPTWKAGTEFRVVEYRHSLDVPTDADDNTKARLEARASYTLILMVGIRFYSLYRVGPGHKEQYAALEAALEPCPESLAAMYDRLDVRDDYFARWLVESGRLSRELFERLWLALQEDGDLTSADWPRKTGRPLVEEASAEELGVETPIDALNRIAAPKCRACLQPMSTERRPCRGRTGGGYCSE